MAHDFLLATMRRGPADSRGIGGARPADLGRRLGVTTAELIARFIRRPPNAAYGAPADRRRSGASAVSSRQQRAQYEAQLNLSVQRVWDEWHRKLTYAELVAGLVETCAGRMRAYAKRVQD